MLSIDSRNIFFFSLCLLLSCCCCCCCCCCVGRHPREKRERSKILEKDDEKTDPRGWNARRAFRIEITTRDENKSVARVESENLRRELSLPNRRVRCRARARARARLRKSKKTTKADLVVARQKRHFKPHFSKAHLFHILVAVVTLHVRLFFALRVRVVIVVRERDVVVRTGLVSSFFSSSSSFRTHSSYFFLCPEECGRRVSKPSPSFFLLLSFSFFLANFRVYEINSSLLRGNF